jgi:small-conductance mechanosensitive channel
MDRHLLSAWLLDTLLFGIPIANWLIGLLAAVGSFIVMTTAVRLAVGRAQRLAEHTSTRLDNIVVEVFGKTNHWLLALASVLIGVGLLDLPVRWTNRIEHLWFMALALQFALWVNAAVTIALRNYVARHSTGGMTQVGASATLMSWGLRTTLWAVVLLAMLSNLGVNITAFVASLGVGGVAVALAVQNILGDLFASLSIAVDKPFEVGDFIVFGAVSGSVEHVGLKTTRIRSLSGEQIVVGNTELLKQTISNYKRMSERRIAFKFGVTYDVSPSQAQEIPKVVRRIIESSPKLRFDRAHLQALAESSLDYEVVYFVLDADYNLYMDLQQMINVHLLGEFQRMNVRFAYPTRTLEIVGNALFAAPAGQRDGLDGTTPTSPTRQ